MYICLDCGCLFEEPKHYVETHGLDSPPYESYCGCPSCGGVYIEAERCDNCGEWITGEYAVVEDKRYCDCCYTVYNIGY